MKTYQSCGKISIENNSKTAIVKTMLPQLLHNGKYEYVKYFNISNNNHFGILGILVVKGEPNTDLRKYNAENRSIQVDENAIILTELEPINGGKSFTTLTNTDSICFMCFHDDTFVATAEILKKFQDSLPKFPFEDQIPDNKEPMVGSGGILTFQGC